MTRTTGLVAAAIVGLLHFVAAPACAESQRRAFHDRGGRQLTAEVVEVQADEVKLRTKAGVKVYPITAFSDADQAYLMKLLKAKQNSGGAAQPEPTAETVNMDCVNDIAFSPDGRHVAAGANGKTPAAIWRAEDGKLVNALGDASGRGLSAIAFSPKSMVVATGSWRDGVVALVRVPAGVEIRRLVHRELGSPQSKDGPPWELFTSDVAFSPDATRLVVGATGHGARPDELFVWDTRSGRKLHQERIGKRSATHSIAVAVSGDGHLIACQGVLGEDSRSSVIVWDAATMKRRHVLRGNDYEYIEALAFSPKEPLIAASSEKRIVLWNAETGAEVRSLGARAARSLGFSSDGKRLVSGSALQGVAVHDVETGRNVWGAKTPADLVAKVNAVAFHPDGKRVAAGTKDGRVICWDTEAGSVLWTAHGPR